jgi:BirA family biotin operon repressor/biotin-[acetyl-CoA-carboxylase] ligase
MKSKHDIIWLENIDSTNNEVQRQISELDNLSVVAAEYQSEGKGQGDHKWHSKPGENMLLSIILKDTDIKPSEQVKISNITAQSVVELLKNHSIQAWIKPPNDIWVDTKKICGILIEHSLRGNHISWSIIGIGLNVNQTSFPDDLPNPTSLKLEKEGADIEQLISELMDIFTRRASELWH